MKFFERGNFLLQYHNDNSHLNVIIHYKQKELLFVNLFKTAKEFDFDLFTKRILTINY